MPDQSFVTAAAATDTATPPGWITTVIRRPTAAFYCTPTGGVTDLDADHLFPAMTTPEQALTMLGYTLTAPPEGTAAP
jgi:hypothetical protein